MSNFEGMTDQEIVELAMDKEAYEIYIARTRTSAYLAGMELAAFNLETRDNPTYTNSDDYQEWRDRKESLQFGDRFPLELSQPVDIFTIADEHMSELEAFNCGERRIYSAALDSTGESA